MAVSGAVRNSCLGLLLVCPGQSLGGAPSLLVIGVDIAALAPFVLAGVAGRRTWLLAGLYGLLAAAAAYVMTVLVVGQVLNAAASAGVGLIVALCAAGLVALPAPGRSKGWRSATVCGLVLLSVAVSDEDNVLWWVVLFFATLPAIAVADALAERRSR